MTLTGYLSDYSLPEIFQFVEQGYKTGLLSIQSEPDAFQQQGEYYLWFQGGRIVALANQLDNNALLSMLTQRGWLDTQTVKSLPELSHIEQPLGQYLKAQGAITTEHIKLLFHAQVLRPICGLFKQANAKFAFEPKTTLPLAEMTGLSLSAAEASLLGLRVLRDWKALSEKLPDPNFGLVKIHQNKPQLQLENQEWQVWECADKSISLQAIALTMQLPVATVQQIAFRLSVIGLVEEVAIGFETPSRVAEKMPEMAAVGANGNTLKVSFLQNLVGFLKKVA